MDSVCMLVWFFAKSIFISKIASVVSSGIGIQPTWSLIGPFFWSNCSKKFEVSQARKGWFIICLRYCELRKINFLINHQKWTFSKRNSTHFGKKPQPRQVFRINHLVILRTNYREIMRTLDESVQCESLVKDVILGCSLVLNVFLIILGKWMTKSQRLEIFLQSSMLKLDVDHTVWPVFNCIKWSSWSNAHVHLDLVQFFTQQMDQFKTLISDSVQEFISGIGLGLIGHLFGLN